MPYTKIPCYGCPAKEVLGAYSSSTYPDALGLKCDRRDRPVRGKPMDCWMKQEQGVTSSMASAKEGWHPNLTYIAWENNSSKNYKYLYNTGDEFKWVAEHVVPTFNSNTYNSMNFLPILVDQKLNLTNYNIKISLEDSKLNYYSTADVFSKTTYLEISTGVLTPCDFS